MVKFLSDIEKMSQILGKENIDCLINLFEEMNGQPPRVDKKRYRANHPDQISILNYLENSVYLIKSDTIKRDQFYDLRSYALPLIKTPKAQSLLSLMCEIYQRFSIFYKERLDTAVSRDEIIKAVNAPAERILEALSYLKDSHSVWTRWENEFPYGENSQIILSEDVIFKRDFLEVLTDYYRWNFIDKKSFNSDVHKEIIIPKLKIEDKKVGRPSIKSKIIAAYKHLKEENKIDYSKTLKAHTELIQETVQILFPEIKNNVGMGHEAIRRSLAKDFQEERTSKSTSKL